MSDNNVGVNGVGGNIENRTSVSESSAGNVPQQENAAVSDSEAGLCDEQVTKGVSVFSEVRGRMGEVPSLDIEQGPRNPVVEEPEQVMSRGLS